jgi:hypothetical protein
MPKPGVPAEHCFDEVHAMSRFRCVKFFAALLALAHSVDFAHPHIPFSVGSSARASMNELGYVVGGDVQNLKSWTLSGSRVTVREAVLKAGLLTEPSSVTVIRRNQDRPAWTQLVSTTSADSGEIVMDGDIVIVQSLNSMQRPNLGNAILRTDAGSLIVGLADSSVAIGDILQQTQHSVSETMPLALISRFQGRPTVRMPTLFSEVSHGDVISISTTQRKLAGFGNLVPAFSEWQSAAASPVANSSAQIEQTSASDLMIDRRPIARDSEISRFPDIDAHDQAEALISQVPEDPEFQVSTKLKEVNASLHVAPISQTTFPESLESLAPAPPVEGPDSAAGNKTQASDNSGLWNTLFIAALMISGVLIIVGSFLSGDTSQETSAVRSAELTAAVPSKNHSFGHFAGASGGIPDDATAESEFKLPVPAGTSSARKPLGHTSLPAIGAAARPDVAPPAEAPGSDTAAIPRWFSNDWTQKSAKRSMIDSDTAPGHSLPTTNVSQRTSTEEHAFQPRTEIRSSGAVDTPDIQQSKSPINSSSPSAAPVESCPGLDDLIENRLPMDLQQARFPLQITLFGRAAGPRHLRIDAAQPVLPGPHASFHSGTTSGFRSRSVGTTSSASESQGRFDRALSSLEERSES